MANKFTLLTTLTLSMAGFNTGIDKAKKGAKALSDGVKTAGNTMAGAFSPLQGALGSLGGQLGGVTDVALGGIKSFKAMIPAINGIKTALISTGIGAIVVAIGVAFAALMSYMKGTEEGANKLQKVMAFMKGAFNAILQRVQLLGEAVSLVFEGKFKQAGEKLKEAFQGGLLQEIKDDAKEAVGYAERENKLWSDKLALKKRESDVTTQINDLKLIAWNQELPAAERQKAITKAKELELSLMNEKVRVAQEEYDIVKSQNAMGKNSRADTEKEIDLYVQINSEKNAYLKSQREYLEKQVQINNALKAQAVIERELPIAAINTADALKNVSLSISKIDTTKLVEVKTVFVDIKKSIIDVYDLLSSVLPNAVVGLTTAFGKLFAGTKAGFKGVVTTALQAVQQIINALLAQAIAGMIAGESNKGLFGIITASIGVASLLALWESKIPEFANGGIVSSPTLAMVGEYRNAKTNPEVIAPLSKLQAMIGGPGNGEVTFRIEGDTLVGVLNNYGRKLNSFK